MKIFSVYMAKRFFKPFVFGLALFALLIFLGDMFDKMNSLIKSPAPIGIILAYLWLEVPYWTIRVFPMATLLATLIALTGFVQSGEWIAVQACGFRTRDFWKPLLWCALAVTVIAFAGQETVLPACFARAQRLWQERIHPEWEYNTFANVSLIGNPGEFIQARMFLPRQGRMDGPVLDKTGPTGITYELDARKALWDPARRLWTFYDGVERTFQDDKVAERYFSSEDSDLTVPPANLVPRMRNPDEMSLRELAHYSRSARHLGLSRRELEMAVASKIAYPFANFIIAALGIPVALRLRRSPRIFSFCAALAISFLYLWMMELGNALGQSGAAPPFLAAWTANLAFGGLAVFLIRRYDA